jgi:hypothetical protein
VESDEFELVQTLPTTSDKNPRLPPNVALRYEIELLHVADTWDNTYGAEPEVLQDLSENW